jgi:hypothetical protein
VYRQQSRLTLRSGPSGHCALTSAWARGRGTVPLSLARAKSCVYTVHIKRANPSVCLGRRHTGPAGHLIHIHASSALSHTGWDTGLSAHSAQGCPQNQKTVPGLQQRSRGDCALSRQSRRLHRWRRRPHPAGSDGLCGSLPRPKSCHLHTLGHQPCCLSQPRACSILASSPTPPLVVTSSSEAVTHHHPCPQPSMALHCPQEQAHILPCCPGPGLNPPSLPEPLPQPCPTSSGDPRVLLSLGPPSPSRPQPHITSG